MVLANSSERPWMSWLSLAIVSARSDGDMRGHGPRSKAARAAATARSMSAVEASGTRAMISSECGEITSIDPVPAGSTHFPSM